MADSGSRDIKRVTTQNTKTRK